MAQGTRRRPGVREKSNRARASTTGRARESCNGGLAGTRGLLRMEKMASAATPRPCVGGVGGSMGAKRIREDENALVPAPTTPKPLIRLLVTNADLGKSFITSGGISGIVEALSLIHI